MATRREFPALRRRRHYLEQEVYTYDKWLRDGKELDAATQHRMALDANDHSEELDELDYILRFMDRLSNGYHLSQTQWLLLLAAVVLAVVLAMMAVIL